MLLQRHDDPEMHRLLQGLVIKAVVSLIEFAIDAASHCIPVPISRLSVEILQQPSRSRKIRDVVYLTVRAEIFGFPEVF